MVRDAADPSGRSSTSLPDVNSRKQDRQAYDGALLDSDSDHSRGEPGAGMRGDHSEHDAGQEFGGQEGDRNADLEGLVAGLLAETASLRAQVAALCATAADRDRQLSDLAARVDRLENAP